MSESVDVFLKTIYRRNVINFFQKKDLGRPKRSPPCLVVRKVEALRDQGGWNKPCNYVFSQPTICDYALLSIERQRGGRPSV